MLKLVVDNTNENNVNGSQDKTCRSHCLNFDASTNECGFFKDINLDDPKTTERCQKYFEWEKDLDVEEEEIFELIDDEFSVEFESSDFPFEIMGDKFEKGQSEYPFAPDFDCGHEDGIWFVAEDESFGCWIINHSKKRFLDVNSHVAAKEGWSEKIYKSPYPLHNHNASAPLCSRMAWYVEQDGYGQYVLVINGKIQMLTEKKPKSW